MRFVGIPDCVKSVDCILAIQDALHSGTSLSCLFDPSAQQNSITAVTKTDIIEVSLKAKCNANACRGPVRSL